MYDRTKHFGGSDAYRITRGHKEIVKLWKEKTGRAQPDDLSAVFRVQLGVFTETFHREWLYRHHPTVSPVEPPVPVMYRGWKAASLDGWCENTDLPVEFKHTNERSDLDSMLSTYLPQLAHYMAISKAKAIWLSFIRGNNDPEVNKIEVSASYIDKLMLLEDEFWSYVKLDEEPTELFAEEAVEEAEIKPDEILINDMRTVSMEGNNEWAALAFELVTTQKARDAFESAKKEIKKFMDKDVRLAEGHGIKLSRDKRGYIQMKVEEDELL